MGTSFMFPSEILGSQAWCFAAAAYSTRAGGEPEHLLALAAQAQQHVAELEAQHVANR